MGMSKLRLKGAGGTVCGKAYLRVYRNPVLEPGEDSGDQGQGAASVKMSASGEDGSIFPDSEERFKAEIYMLGIQEAVGKFLNSPFDIGGQGIVQLENYEGGTAENKVQGNLCEKSARHLCGRLGCGL